MSISCGRFTSRLVLDRFAKFVHQLSKYRGCKCGKLSVWLVFGRFSGSQTYLKRAPVATNRKIRLTEYYLCQTVVHLMRARTFALTRRR